MSTKKEDEDLFFTVILWALSPILWPIGWIIDKFKEKVK
jgi:hypothetical protein